MPYYKVNIGAYRLDVFGEDVDKALDNLSNIRFYPRIETKDGITKWATYTLHRKPLKNKQ